MLKDLSHEQEAIICFYTKKNGFRAFAPFCLQSMDIGLNTQVILAKLFGNLHDSPYVFVIQNNIRPNKFYLSLKGRNLL